MGRKVVLFLITFLSLLHMILFLVLPLHEPTQKFTGPLTVSAWLFKFKGNVTEHIEPGPIVRNTN